MELFSGKTVVVSGGAEGIGFAVAQAVGREGMNVVITDVSTGTLSAAERDVFARYVRHDADVYAHARRLARLDRVAGAALAVAENASVAAAAATRSDGAKLGFGGRRAGEVVRALGEHRDSDSPERRWLDAQAARPEHDCGWVSAGGVVGG